MAPETKRSSFSGHQSSRFSGVMVIIDIPFPIGFASELHQLQDHDSVEKRRHRPFGVNVKVHSNVSGVGTTLTFFVVPRASQTRERTACWTSVHDVSVVFWEIVSSVQDRNFVRLSVIVVKTFLLLGMLAPVPDRLVHVL